MANNANKIALVTGGSRGLGKDSALQLATKGFNVIITYQTKKEAAEAVIADIEAIGQKAFALPLDISSTKGFDAFKDAVQHILDSQLGGKKLDALVNNAGTGINAPFKYQAYVFAASPLAVNVPDPPLQRGSVGRVIVGFMGLMPVVIITMFDEGDSPQTLVAVA